MKIVRNIAGLLIGLFAGGLINLAITYLNGSLVPLAEGIDPQNMESLKANLHRYTFPNLAVVFLAHAGGTFVGALIAGGIAQSAKVIFCYIVGFFFLIGGIIMIVKLPSSLGFAFVDLAFAYIPMAWLAAKIVNIKKS